jgi:hypothetical protein
MKQGIGENRRGYLHLHGKIKFIEHYDFKKEDGWRNDEEDGEKGTGPLPWTDKKGGPTGWDDNGSIDHELNVDWDTAHGNSDIRVSVVPTK